MVTSSTMEPSPACPHCQSTDVSRPYFSRRLFAWGLLLLGFPFIWFRRERWCFGCSKAFKAKGKH